MASLLRGVLGRGGIRGRAVDDHGFQLRKFSSKLSGVEKEINSTLQSEREGKLRLFGIEWKMSFDQILAHNLLGSKLPPLIPPPDGTHSHPTKRDIILSAASVVKFVDKLVENEPRSDILNAALYKIYTDPTFQTYDEATKMKVMSRVLRVIQYYPQSHPNEVFHMKSNIRSFSVDDGKNILTKKQVTSRVVGVVQSYPLARQHTVTRRTHFRKDLHLDEDACRYIRVALQTTFKMGNKIPDWIDSCICAIDYIYGNQECRMSLQDFRGTSKYTCPRLKDRLVLRVIELRKQFLAWLAT